MSKLDVNKIKSIEDLSYWLADEGISPDNFAAALDELLGVELRNTIIDEVCTSYNEATTFNSDAFEKLRCYEGI